MLILGVRKSATWFPSLLPEAERRVVRQPVTVRALAESMTITLDDGTTRRLTLGTDGFRIDMTNTDPGDRFHQNFFPLENVAPQSFSLEMPDFIVNDERLHLGRVKFDYRPTQVLVGC
jgi:hypothetical protein